MITHFQSPKRVVLAVALLGFVPHLAAQDKPPPPSALYLEFVAIFKRMDQKVKGGPTPGEQPAPEAKGFDAASFNRISEKPKAALPLEEQLAPDFKAIDDLVAKHAQEKSEDVAVALVHEGRLYIEVLDNYPKGLALLRTVKAEYPDAKIAQKLDRVLPKLEARAEVEAQFQVGKTLPGFSETDLDGQPLVLEKYKGKAVLVDFWATWCGPCVTELPNIQAAYAKFHGRGFEIIGVSLDQDRGALTGFLRNQNVPWVQYFDGLGWKSKLGSKYGINSIPASFLLDEDGVIVARNLRGEALGAKLAILLAPANSEKESQGAGVK